ncbi:MAG: MIP/aquaporin family protein [Chloroflexota bacterium]
MRSIITGELLGTFLMVLIGTGSVACAVLTGALQGLWQVAVVWGIGVTLAIHCTAGLSGAHLNPAVTLAFAVVRPGDVPWSRVPLYWAAQLVGAIVAGLAVWAVFGSLLARFETREGLARGAPGSERAAMIFGQYFPNAAMFGGSTEAAGLVSPMGAVLVEALGTGLLMLVILAVTDTANPSAPPRGLVPLMIGATVAALIAVFAPVTQAGWNPARDLGPRIVAYLVGFGPIAFPGPLGGFWIYIVGPMLGAVVGALVYTRGVRQEQPKLATAEQAATPRINSQQRNGHRRDESVQKTARGEAEI